MKESSSSHRSAGVGGVEHSSWAKDKRLFPCLETVYRAAEAKGACLGLHPEGKECAWGLSDSRDLSTKQSTKQSAQQGWAASVGYAMHGSFSSRM